MKVFVPFTDDMLDDPAFAEMLVPYQAGSALLSQLETEEDQSRCKTITSPGTSPSSDALPALSSSTYRAGPSLG